ncbi:hypothetical protein H634G_07436 [Metarhizium anisopliae BRIP 53293]|uniref:Uncharacterized protein n=1 Tax=Metarhizium anisopliae BRIP 53293 TaxID=1291518 RepID=A0A0D9NUJ3_METAN|nr:hypothetical protein H634G_07436 [Metarhizium anisopliae BRIP 53293]KJK88309.1 hypothetical protein H633G_07811 [Metarhizium anisopliae BRIP 53284]
MSSKSFFVLKTKAIPSRYQLSKNIQTLLEGLDSYHVGSLDVEELGRLVRLSPRRRAAVANTITKCANILKKDPSEVKTCVDIIEMCTEILEIADRQSSTEGFPFMKMPIEIRARTLDLIIDNTFRTPVVVPAGKPSPCRCPRFDRDNVFQTSQMKALPTLLGAALGEEFYRIFFPVHWCGPESANTFKLLPQLLKLESLTLNISKSTLVHLNERASLMRTHFPLAYRNIRMSDILGLDELLLVRGLQDVHVFNVQPKSNSHGVEMDRVCLWDLLTSQLTQPREDLTNTLSL